MDRGEMRALSPHRCLRQVEECLALGSEDWKGSPTLTSCSTWKSGPGSSPGNTEQLALVCRCGRADSGGTETGEPAPPLAHCYRK